jgi:hypothetical protein
MYAVWRDLVAIRQFRRQPGLCVRSCRNVGSGNGANIAVFSVDPIEPDSDVRKRLRKRCRNEGS